MADDPDRDRRSAEPRAYMPARIATMIDQRVFIYPASAVQITRVRTMAGEELPAIRLKAFGADQALEFVASADELETLAEALTDAASAMRQRAAQMASAAIRKAQGK